MRIIRNDMFKALGIIESFGTGIGKAKRSMRENGSPDLFYKTFAEYVRSECEKNDIPCIINDGLISKDEMFEKVKKLFGL